MTDKVTKPKKRKSPRRDPLDDLFSEYIRRRAIQRVGGCERCLSQKHDTTREDGSTRPSYMDLQCSHYIGRTTHVTRFDPDNCCGICGGCHMYLEHHPHEHHAWFLEHLGQEAYDMLQARYRRGAKPDRAALTLYYKIQIKLLKEGDMMRRPDGWGEERAQLESILKTGGIPLQSLIDWRNAYEAGANAMLEGLREESQWHSNDEPIRVECDILKGHLVFIPEDE